MPKGPDWDESSVSGWVIYNWIAEARAKPYKHLRVRCGTRQQARQSRDHLNASQKKVVYVVRRMSPPVVAPLHESAYLEAEKDEL